MHEIIRDLFNSKMTHHERITCGAKTRGGEPCQAQAMANGRCRNHGGLSTGARTEEGRKKSLAAIGRIQSENWEPHPTIELVEAHRQKKLLRLEWAQERKIRIEPVPDPERDVFDPDDGDFI